MEPRRIDQAWLKKLERAGWVILRLAVAVALIRAILHLYLSPNPAPYSLENDWSRIWAYVSKWSFELRNAAMLILQAVVSLGMVKLLEYILREEQKPSRLLRSLPQILFVMAALQLLFGVQALWHAFHSTMRSTMASPENPFVSFMTHLSIAGATDFAPFLFEAMLGYLVLKTLPIIAESKSLA